MVLFLSQLFSDGVNYINECGLIVLAVHMGIALSCHGLMPIDKEGGMGVLGVAGSRNRSGSNRNDSDLFLGHGDGRAAAVPLDVPSVSVGRLITLYAQGLQSTDPKVGVVLFFIILLPSFWFLDHTHMLAETNSLCVPFTRLSGSFGVHSKAVDI